MTFHSRFGVYGENEKTLKWTKAKGLRYSRNGHCLHWLSKGRCNAGVCHEGLGSRNWMDHVTGWIDKDGNRLLLCQPSMGFGGEGLQSLLDAANVFNLDMRITGEGWYGFGTIAIELTPVAAKAKEKENDHELD
jgi:hypothetical protein